MKCMNVPPTLFQRNFDADQFDRIKVSIQKEIEGAQSVENLMRQLKHIPNVRCVEFADDDDLDNADFVLGYRSEEDDSCDFLVILCYVELDRSEMETNSQYAEVCFYIVYNDVKQTGWIDAASLASADNPEDYAESICFFDLETHTPILLQEEGGARNQD